MLIPPAKPQDAPCARPADQAREAALARSPPTRFSPRLGCPEDSQSTYLPASRTRHGSTRQMACAATPRRASAPPIRRSAVRRPASLPPASHPAEPVPSPRWSRSTRLPWRVAATQRRSNPTHQEASLSSQPSLQQPSTTRRQPARTGQPALPASSGH